LQLPSVPPRKDLDLVARAYGLPPATGDAEVIMLDIARKDGFGKFITRVLDAVDLAESRHTKVTWEHFLKAHAICERMLIDPDAKPKK
jgi:hypothetical protein